MMGMNNRTPAHVAFAVFVAVVVAFSSPQAPAAVTATFGTDANCTYPGAVKVAGKAVTVDLSAVGAAEVYRAVLVPRKDAISGTDEQVLKPVTMTADGLAVELMPPRYRSFDATAAARAALKAGKPLALTVESLPGWDGRTVRLEVAFAGKAKAKSRIPAVTGLAARHRGGQTILTFREVNSPLTAETIGIEDFAALRRKLAASRPQVAYRVYRSADGPITPATIGKAALVDEVGQLTAWNDEYYGGTGKKDSPTLRYAVQDGKPPVPPGTGIYAHNPPAAGKAWYAVAAAVDGQEDLDALGEGCTAGPVDETVGPGEPVLQRTETPKEFNYVANPTLRYYVRWEAPPRCNLPSRPFDYVVAEPAKPVWPAPVYIAFHCWGANLNSGYGWWYQRPPSTSLLIATNQIPYDWWTGYHESKDTWRPWSQGAVRSYSFARIDAFYEWVCGKWQVDRTRTIAGGNSMGGSGSCVYATHHAASVAWVASWVGVHTPAQTPTFHESYEGCYGRVAWKLKHESGQAAFDYFDDAAWVRSHPEVSMPLMCFGNGKDDGAIGWPQALEYFRALQEARQPHVFHWDLGGHSVRCTLPGPGASGSSMALDVRTDQSLPAFTACSLDEDPGTGKALTPPKELKGGDGRVRKDYYDGDPSGHANRWLYWETKDVVDEPKAWEMTILLTKDAPADECTVNVTPRRCQKFKPAAGAILSWTAKYADGRPAVSGKGTADKWGLVTMEKIKATKGGTRVRVVVVE